MYLITCLIQIDDINRSMQFLIGSNYRVSQLGMLRFKPKNHHQLTPFTTHPIKNMGNTIPMNTHNLNHITG